MTVTLVRFRTARGLFAVPVDQTREVRPVGGLVPMPASRPDVAGVVPSEHGALTVLTSLGPGRNHVLVLEADDRTFGLFVEEVTGLMRLDDDDIGSPPPGQDEDFVTGVVASPDGLVLVVDARALAKGLGG